MANDWIKGMAYKQSANNVKLVFGWKSNVVLPYNLERIENFESANEHDRLVREPIGDREQLYAMWSTLHHLYLLICCCCCFFLVLLLCGSMFLKMFMCFRKWTRLLFLSCPVSTDAVNGCKTKYSLNIHTMDSHRWFHMHMIN